MEVIQPFGTDKSVPYAHIVTLPTKRTYKFQFAYEFTETDHQKDILYTQQKLGKEEMSALVQQHKEHETEQQLGGFNQKYFHWMRK